MRVLLFSRTHALTHTAGIVIIVPTVLGIIGARLMRAGPLLYVLFDTSFIYSVFSKLVSMAVFHVCHSGAVCIHHQLAYHCNNADCRLRCQSIKVRVSFQSPINKFLILGFAARSLRRFARRAVSSTVLRCHVLPLTLVLGVTWQTLVAEPSLRMYVSK